MNTLLERLQILEDIERIKQLKAHYCKLADHAYADSRIWEQLISYFVDDAWLDFGDFGLYRGKQEVSKFFKEVTHEFLSYAAHMVVNPVIQVRGDSALGKWRVFCPCTERASNTALWVQGEYRDEFVRVDGELRWRSISCSFDFVAPYHKGWASVAAMR